MDVEVVHVKHARVLESGCPVTPAKPGSGVATPRTARHGDRQPEKQAASEAMLPRFPTVAPCAQLPLSAETPVPTSTQACAPSPSHPAKGSGDLIPRLQVPRGFSNNGTPQSLPGQPQSQGRQGPCSPNLLASLADQPPRSGETQHSGLFS